MNILITGGNGFLGSYLKNRLDIEGVNYFSPTSTEMDIQSIESIKTFFELNKVDKIVHLAADADHTSEQCFQINSLGTYNLAKAARENHVRHFLYTSTNNVYGIYGDNIKEDDQTVPSNHYGDSKLLGEYIVKSVFPERHTILRFSDIFGINQKYGNLMKRFIENSLEKKQNIIYGTGIRTRDYLYVDDAVSSIIHVLKYEKNGTFNISTGVSTTTKQLSVTIGKVFGYEQEPQYKEYINEDVSVVVLNNDKITATGFNIEFSLEEGLADMKRRMSEYEKD